MTQALISKSKTIPVELHDGKHIVIEAVGDRNEIVVSVDGVRLGGLVSFGVSFEGNRPIIKIVRYAEPFNAATREHSEIVFTRLESVALKAEVTA